MFLNKSIDEKLKLAFELYNKELCESLPAEDELSNIIFSENFEAKMQKLISVQKKSYFYLINTVSKRVAIIVLTIIIGLTATTFGVKAIRETVIDFVTKTFEKFTTISIKNGEVVTPDEFVKTEPKYIPEGFSVDSKIETNVSIRIEYKNNENFYIGFSQRLNVGGANVDTEGVEFEKIYINGFEGIKYTNKGENTIIFADKFYLYKFYGQVPFDELIKMAESVIAE